MVKKAVLPYTSLFPWQFLKSIDKQGHFVIKLPDWLHRFVTFCCWYVFFFCFFFLRQLSHSEVIIIVINIIASSSLFLLATIYNNNLDRSGISPKTTRLLAESTLSVLIFSTT